MNTWLPLSIYTLLGGVVFVYAVMDGFVIGIGINWPWVGDAKQREQLLRVVAPIWDGNETWMVLAAAILYGAFPTGFAMIFPRFYLSLMLLVVALIARGMAIECYFKDYRHQQHWGRVFAAASATIASLQGSILSRALLGPSSHGIALWVMHAIAAPGLCCGYALLGSTYLIRKTHDPLQGHCFRLARKQLLWLMGCYALVTVASPLLSDRIYSKWFTWPNALWLAPLPVASLACFVIGYRHLRQQRSELSPFYLSISLMALAYVGQLQCWYPYLVPYQLTYWEAASHPRALRFIAIGLAMMLPVLLGYNAYAYRVFQGKTGQGEY